MAARILSIFNFEPIRFLLRCWNPAVVRLALAGLLLVAFWYYALDALAPLPLLLVFAIVAALAYRLAQPHGHYLTILLLSLLLFFLAGECYMRLQTFGPKGLSLKHYKPADYGNPFAGFSYATNTYTGLAPGSSLWFKGAPFSVNTDGFRGADFPAPDAPPADLQLAVLGASAEMGAGVPDGSPYPARLQQQLRQHPGRQHTHVLNYGISGSNWGNMLHLLQAEVLSRKPDLILFHVHPKLATSLAEQPRLATPFTGTTLELYANSRYRFFRNHSFFARLLWMSRKGNLLHQQLARQPDQPTETTLLHDRQQAFRTLLRRLTTYAPDIPIVLFILRPMSTAPESSLSQAYRAFARTTATAQGFPLIDGYTYELPAAEVSDMILYACDHHPNQAGHAYHTRMLLTQLQPLLDHLFPPGEPQ